MDLNKDALARQRVNGVVYYQIADGTDSCELCVCWDNGLPYRTKECGQIQDRNDCSPGVWVTAAYKPEFIAKLVARRLESTNEHTDSTN